MFTRLFFTNVARAASRNVASWAYDGRTDTSTPFSYAPSISRSNRSSFFIGISRSKIISRRLPAWNDGLQEVMCFLFDRGNKKNIAAICHNEHNLTGDRRWFGWTRTSVRPPSSIAATISSKDMSRPAFSRSFLSGSTGMASQSNHISTCAFVIN